MTAGFTGTGIHRAAYASGSGGWFDYVAIGLLIFGACALLLFAVSTNGRSDGDDSSGADGGGRRGPAGGPTPPDGPPEAEPEWWPEFERQFATYVNRSGVDRHLVSV